MPAEPPAAVLLVDADAARGARAVLELAASGFPAVTILPAAALQPSGSGRAHILAVARGAAPGRARAAIGDHPLAPGEIAALRRAVEASLVLLWIEPAEISDPNGAHPAWADGVATGIASLIGRVALHARAAAIPFGELAQSRARLGEVRKAAHDLTQPLTTIVARAKLLLESVEEGDPSRRAIAIIAQESERLAKSVDRIRELLPPRRRG